MTLILTQIAPPDFRQRFGSTRAQAEPVNLATAVLTGPATDGGLWVPETIVPFTKDELDWLETLPFVELAALVAHRLIGNDLDHAELSALVHDAFDFEMPLQSFTSDSGTDPTFDVRALELFHGPTLAFKDVGARFMARLLRWARTQQPSTETQRDLTILAATSGDTGSAVAQAFLGLEGFRVAVLFPRGQVSEAQRKLFTTLGQNTCSFSIDGSFDDCQRLVKQAFADSDLRQRLPLGSANSINIARLLPQTLYYFWIRNQLSPSDRARPLRICVPSGNFGNLTAGLLARRLGLRVDTFIAATNANDIVPQFLSGKKYSPRPSVCTVANAMDVGDPSNFERIQWLFEGRDDAIRQAVTGTAYTDAEVAAAMRQVHETLGLLLDPHSTIGYLGARDHHRANRRPDAPAPIYAFLATAHPAKFAEVVHTTTDREVEIPPALVKALAGREQVTDLAPDYAQFRAALEHI